MNKNMIWMMVGLIFIMLLLNGVGLYKTGNIGNELQKSIEQTKYLTQSVQNMQQMIRVSQDSIQSVVGQLNRSTKQLTEIQAKSTKIEKELKSMYGEYNKQLDKLKKMMEDNMKRNEAIERELGKFKY